MEKFDLSVSALNTLFFVGSVAKLASASASGVRFDLSPRLYRL